MFSSLHPLSADNEGAPQKAKVRKKAMRIFYSIEDKSSEVSSSKVTEVQSDAIDIITDNYRISVRIGGFSIFDKSKPDEPIFNQFLDFNCKN